MAGEGWPSKLADGLVLGANQAMRPGGWEPPAGHL